MAASKLEANSGQFQKGRAKTGGRLRGTPNKVTRAAKAFLAEIIDRADVREAVRDRILAGDMAFFRPLDHVIGKPRQAVDLPPHTKIIVQWRK